jgi:hypothetical protein
MARPQQKGFYQDEIVMKLKFILSTIFILIAMSSFAQSEAERLKLQEIEAQKQADRQRQISMRLDSAIRLSESGAYEEADKKFRSILTSIKSVPSDFTFHFGKNSFFLKKYKQSIDWLNKYIQLKGTSGQFSAQAVDWKTKSEAELLKEKKEQMAQTAQVLSQDYNIDCGPSGKAVCPVCNGTTVVIKKDYLGSKYKTCSYCAKQGFLSCEDYNKLLRGELKPALN